ncbi:MAG: hypothetical protein JJ974_03930 [Phycisphaerales bacterium]|nr:hypothetical protein [Phycisphaerales bacterium]
MSATQKNALEEAKGFLIEALRDGERAASEMMDEAERLGISTASLNRARQALAIKTFRKGKAWHWVASADPEDEPLGAMRVLPEPDEIPGLRDLTDPEDDYEQGVVPVREDRGVDAG